MDPIIGSNELDPIIVPCIGAFRENASNLSYDSLTYEIENHDPNCSNDTFFNFLDKFNLNPNVVDQSIPKIKKMCNDAYDRYWKMEINKQNSKAISYCKFKNTNCLEPYLSQKI